MIISLHTQKGVAGIVRCHNFRQNNPFYRGYGFGLYERVARLLLWISVAKVFFTLWEQGVRTCLINLIVYDVLYLYISA